jgi:opacity protein-like surface antigen
MMTLTKLLRTSAAALGALAVASVTQANAADIFTGGGGGGYKDIPAPLPIWAGFYIGGNLGIAESQIDIARRSFLIPDDAGREPPNFATIGGRTLGSEGGFGGGQIGYNWQYGGSCCFVYGIELDLGGVASRNERNFIATSFDVDPTEGVAGAVAARVKVNDGFYGDITGRLGYTWGNSLLYAKGGFAWLNANVSISATVFDAEDGTVTFIRGREENRTLTGFTVGGGWEYLLNPNWSMKVEYLFFDFGNIDNRCCNDGINNFNVTKNDLTVNTVKLGFNYFFRPAVVPLK